VAVALVTSFHGGNSRKQRPWKDGVLVGNQSPKGNVKSMRIWEFFGVYCCWLGCRVAQREHTPLTSTGSSWNFRTKELEVRADRNAAQLQLAADVRSGKRKEKKVLKSHVTERDSAAVFGVCWGLSEPLVLVLHFLFETALDMQLEPTLGMCA
jgi:hypothetical protein